MPKYKRLLNFLEKEQSQGIQLLENKKDNKKDAKKRIFGGRAKKKSGGQLEDKTYGKRGRLG